MWASLNKLTTYQEQNIGGVLPLNDEHGNAVLDRRGKSLITRKGVLRWKTPEKM